MSLVGFSQSLTRALYLSLSLARLFSFRQHLTVLAAHSHRVRSHVSSLNLPFHFIYCRATYNAILGIHVSFPIVLLNRYDNSRARALPYSFVFVSMFNISDSTNRAEL